MNKVKKNQGIVALSITMIVLLIGVTLVLSMVFVFLNRIEIARNIRLSEQAYFTAESGIEDAMLRFFDSAKNLPSSMPYTLAVGSSFSSIDVVTVVGATTLTSVGNSSNRTREVFVQVSDNVTEVSLFYAAQVGDGGLKLEENAKILGNIYSNNSIEGDRGAIITDDAIVAGNGNILEDVSVGGNAQAYQMDDCDITGNATYVTGGGISDCTIGGTITEQSEEIPTLDMPILQSTIDEWKQDAASGGTISVGDFEPSEDVSIGPGIIGDDLTIDNNVTVTITGTVWVKGNIDIKNGGSIVLDSSYGSNSGVIITDGWVHTKNNGIFRGSGQTDSYLMLLTTLVCQEFPDNDCTHHDAAIDLHNNAKGAIFYAPNGLAYLHNKVEVIQLTAWGLRLGNNSILDYSLGLVNVEFSSGPSGGRNINQWMEQ